MKPDSVTRNDEIIYKVLAMLERQEFSDWYESTFEEYIQGEEGVPRYIIHSDLRKLLRLGE